MSSLFTRHRKEGLLLLDMFFNPLEPLPFDKAGASFNARRAALARI
jgi:hypothetical protein